MAPKGRHRSTERTVFTYGKAVLCSNIHQRAVLKMNPVERILSQLTKVRSIKPNHWEACCPAHDDKEPSLAIKETDDGYVLIKCFAGCEVEDIVNAIGVNMSDLFPDNDIKRVKVKRKLIPPSQALALLDQEANLIAVAAGNIAHGVTLTEADLKRVTQAASRINWLREEGYTTPHV